MLTKQQYKFLKKVSKKDMPCNDLNESRDRIYLYLLDRKLIRTYSVCPDGDIMEKQAKMYCESSEYGNVELLLYRQEHYHFWIPTILSIIAIITSILAILTQNEELWTLLKGWLQ